MFSRSPAGAAGRDGAGRRPRWSHRQQRPHPTPVRRPRLWGDNGYGQFGNNSTTNSTVPVAVNTAGVLAGKTVTAISAGPSTRVRWPTARRTAGATTATGSWATTAPRTRRCRWRWTPPGCWPARRSPRSPPASTTRVRWPTARRTAGATTPTGSSATTAPPTRRCRCAVDTVRACWPARRSPRSPPAYYHTCAVADGQAYCWGYNANGQLGNNSTTDSSVPVAVNTTGRAGRQDGHRDHRRRTTTRVRWPTARPPAGATTTTGSWATTAPPTRRCRWRWTPPGCWPAGRSPRSPPGRPHVCGGRRQGLLLGPATATGSWATTAPPTRSVPVAVDTAGVLAGKTVTAITAGDDHTCAVADGTASCWGWQRLRAAGQQQHHGLDGAGRGGHRRGRWPARRSPRSPPAVPHGGVRGAADHGSAAPDRGDRGGRGRRR